MKKAFIALSTLIASSSFAWAGVDNFICSHRLAAVETHHVPHTTPDRMYRPDVKAEVSIAGKSAIFEGFSSRTWSEIYAKYTYDLWDVNDSKNAATLVVTAHDFTPFGRPTCGRGGCLPLPTRTTFSGELTMADGTVYEFPCWRN